MRLERTGLEKTRVKMSAAKKITELPLEPEFRFGTQRAITSIVDLRPIGHSKLVKEIQHD